MGQRRKHADEGSLVRRTNHSGWIHVEEDPDFNVASITGVAIAALVTAGTAFTLLSRAPMAAGTLCLTFATDATVATRTMRVEVVGYDADGMLRSEVVSFSQAASTTTKKQTVYGYQWIDKIRPLSISPADSGDTLVIGFDNTNANSNPGAGLIVPGNPKSTSEFQVLTVDAFTDPPTIAAAQSTFNDEQGLFYPAFRTGNRAYRFVLHPERC